MSSFNNYVRITHIPTGVFADVHRSSTARNLHKMRTNALRILRMKLACHAFVGPPRLVRDYSDEGWDKPEETYMGVGS